MIIQKQSTTGLDTLAGLVNKIGRGGETSVKELGTTTQNRIRRIVPENIVDQGLEEVHKHLVDLVLKEGKEVSSWSGPTLWS